jgi:hypothetical protein
MRHEGFGFVTDSVTGEPVDGGAVVVGERYGYVDSAGHYSIKTRFNTKEKFVFTAPGYESRTVGMKVREERYREYNVQLVPKAK